MKKQVRSCVHQRRRARRQARARRTRPRRLAARQYRLMHAAQVAAQRQEPIFDASVPAPAVLSFVDDPAAVVDLLNRLRAACHPKRTVVLDLRRVKRLTTCALLVLQSQVTDDKSLTRGAIIYVRPPLDQVAARIWHESLNTPQKSDAAYPLEKALILGRRRQKHKQVEVQLAELLVHRAMHYLSGQKRQDHHAGYRTLVECMSNTFKHADPQTEATENWWVASYPHPGPGPKRWCFAFVDNGVGILESLELKGFFKKLKQMLGLFPNREILQQLVEGKIGSRLGLTYRGKGLPGIYKELKRGRIHNLVIVANDIRTNFATRDYVTLDHPFSGTFLYWELSLPPQSQIS
jgi:hypothetical protein